MRSSSISNIGEQYRSLLAQLFSSAVSAAFHRTVFVSEVRHSNIRGASFSCRNICVTKHHLKETFVMPVHAQQESIRLHEKQVREQSTRNKGCCKFFFLTQTQCKCACVHSRVVMVVSTYISQCCHLIIRLLSVCE